NGDMLTTATNISALNFGTNAWVSYKGTTSTDGILFSTSWYSPAGASNDWVITPAITGIVANSWLVFDAAATSSQFADGFMVKISTTGANPLTDFTSAAVLTVSAENNFWTKHAIDLSSYVGSTIYIAIINNSNDKELLEINNFEIKVLPTNDLNFRFTTPSKGDYNSFNTVGNTIDIVGLIRNEGSASITNYDINIYDGLTTTLLPQVPATAIAPYQSSVFNVTYTMPTVGMHPIKIWVELSGDANPTNDSLTSEYGGASFTPVRSTLFEEGTGTWCGWCPRGAVFMDSVHHANKNLAYVAVHNSNTDPMQVANYDAGISALVGGYPSVMIDRATEIDPSQMFTELPKHSSDFATADLTMTASLSGNVITANVSANFAIDADATHGYRLAFVVTEDGVKGTTSAYDQTNYYSGAAAPNLSGAGLNWDNEANPVPAAKMKYDFVARSIDGNSFGGTVGSLPATITHGTSYSKTFTYTIPATVDSTKLRLVAMVVNNLSGQVHNSKSIDWVKAPNGVNSVISNNEFTVRIYPNPVVNNLRLDIDMNITDNVTYSISNLLGQVVATENIGTLSKNATSSNTINVASLVSGTYFITVKTSKGVYTTKFIKD
ncbi:MAG: hypothetical protein RIQ33_1191, partial [Bacteroidota bacterium]